VIDQASASRERFLQRRLSRFGFWGFLVLAGGQAVRVGLALMLGDPPPAPLDSAGQAVGSLALLALWLLVRGERQLSGRVLSLVDVGTMNAVALGFGVMTLHLPRVAHPIQILLLALIFTFTLRATYVPSSVRQTVLVHVTAGFWLLLAAVLTAERFAAIDPGAREASVRGQLITASTWWLFNSGAAVAATSVIYGLRKEVHEAMQLGQYTLREKLGEGGMGAVYSARHAMLRRPTAIKLLPPRLSDDAKIIRFEREVQRTAELSHPNVVTVFDYGRTPDGIFYYAMEHLDGLDLSELVEQHGPLSPARAIHVLVQICEGLAAAHDVGLIHRDIKPANVFLLRAGRTADLVKLVDFGLVKELGDETDTSNAIVGTPACMAPEVIDAPDAVDERSDLYAVGAVGYFLLTGRYVFEGDSVVDVLGKHLHDEPPPMDRDDLPEGLEELILRCLAKAPADRPESAARLRDLFVSVKGVGPWTLEDAQLWWESAPAEARDLDATEPSPLVTVDFTARSASEDTTL